MGASNFTGMNVAGTMEVTGTSTLTGAITATGGVAGLISGGVNYTKITDKAFAQVANITLSKSFEIVEFSNALANAVMVNITPTSNSVVMLYVDTMNTLGTAKVNFVGAGVKWDSTSGSVWSNGNSKYAIFAFPGSVSNGMQIATSGAANITLG